MRPSGVLNLGARMTVFTVTSQTQLDSALAILKSGDTVQLGAGAYSFVLSSKPFTSNVTITSLDPANPARLSWLKLTDTSNITFKNLEVGRALGSTETVDASLSKINGGSNITFDAVHFHGSMDGNPSNDGTGITFGGVNGIKVINSEFEQLGRGAVFGSSTNITVANNSFHDIRSDGMDFAAVTNVLIDGNHFTNFSRISTDHPDAIQFWTTNTSTPSTDITIRNNVILEGDGSGMQGIFMRDELGTLPYERVTIENNLIYETNMSNGITVMGGKDITIRGNTVLSPSEDTVPVWIRVESVTNATVTRNLTDKFYTATNSNVSITDNLLTANSGLSSSLLSFANLASMTTSQLYVSGYGYTAPTSSGSTTGGTTTTDPTTTTGGTTGGTTTTDGSGSTSGGTTTDGSGSTTGGTTTTKPGKGKGRKGAVTAKTSLTSTDYSSYFSVGTLSDALPELQSISRLTTRKAVTSSASAKALRPNVKSAAYFVSPSTTTHGFDFRRFLTFGH